MAYICAPKWIKVTYQRKKKTPHQLHDSPCTLSSSHTGSVTCKPLTSHPKLHVCVNLYMHLKNLSMIIRYIAPLS